VLEREPAASVLIDDRRESMGYRFTDADLRGFPVVVVLGKRWPDAAEVQYRQEALTKRRHRLVPRAEVPFVARQLLNEAKERQRSAAAASLGPVQMAAMLAKLDGALEAACKQAGLDAAEPEGAADVQEKGSPESPLAT
jgi:hypothetical protein